MQQMRQAFLLQIVGRVELLSVQLEMVVLEDHQIVLVPMDNLILLLSTTLQVLTTSIAFI
jgi:phage pi2 protein 07